MPVQPNSVLYLLKGVPLDKSYDDTFYFNQFTQTKADQYNFFNTHFGKQSYTNLSYQRVGLNRIRIQANVDAIRDYNYMMFQNTSYSSKWFYAFVDSVEYINESVSEITYTLDRIQTFYFDFKFEPSYVEREHSSHDSIKENLVEEALQFGDLIVNKKEEHLFEAKTIGSTYHPMYACVVFYVPNDNKCIAKEFPTRETEDQPHQTLYFYMYKWNYKITQYASEIPEAFIPHRASLMNGLYMGCDWYAIPFDLRDDISYTYGDKTCTYKEDTKNKITCLIDKLTEIKASVVNICLVPFDVANDNLNTGELYDYASYMDITPTFSSCDGDRTYTPKNKKMYTYPYRRIVVSNNAGQTVEYKWENFKGIYNRFPFYIKGGVVPSCEVIFLPVNYRGILNQDASNEPDYETSLMLNDFPQLSWNEDTFTKWWSQNKESFVTSMISSAVMSAGSMMTAGLTATGNMGMPTANPMGNAISEARVGNSVAGGIGGLVKTAMPYRVAKNAPDQLYGQLNSSILKSVLGRVGFTIYDIGIDADSAECIDNYFTMFGYACKKIKVPNVFDQNGHIRPNWNYVKTTGAKIHPKNTDITVNVGLTASDVDDLCRIFDKGITFWNPEVEIGDYSLNNVD